MADFAFSALNVTPKSGSQCCKRLAFLLSVLGRLPDEPSWSPRVPSEVAECVVLMWVPSTLARLTRHWEEKPRAFLGC